MNLTSMDSIGSPEALNWRTPTGIAWALRDARRRDPLGHQIHTALALLFLFTMPLATAPKDFAFGILLAWACVRLPHTWRSYRAMVRTPVLVGLMAWSLLHLASLLWSADAKQGWDEFGAQRMFLLPAMLWPVLDRLTWLIAAALAGVAVHNATQIFQALGWLDVRPQDGDGRFRGLIHPIKTGAWCVAAMGWHASAALRLSGWKRFLSIGGFMLATFGLLASESRGPWLGAAIALPAMLVCIAIRRPNLRKSTIIIGLFAVLGCAATWPFVKSQVSARLNDAVSESKLASEKGVYWTSVGLRVGMMKWSWEIFRQHPVIGVGAGGYSHAQSEQADFKQALKRAPHARQKQYITRSHPHSMYLYTLASLGIFGAIVLVIVMGLTLRNAWVDRNDHPYADAMVFVLIAWMIGAQFDCYNLDGHRMGLFALLVAATLPHRAAIRLVRTALEPAAATAKPVATDIEIKTAKPELVAS